MNCTYSSTVGSTHSTQIGVGTDSSSTPLYGQWEDFSVRELPQLDACGGHFGVTPDSNDVSVYHNHVQDHPPFTFGCYGPNDDDNLVTIVQCRTINSQFCGTDSSSVSSVMTDQGTFTYDAYCPCFDGSSNGYGGGGLNTFADTVELASIISRSATASTSPSASSLVEADGPPAGQAGARGRGGWGGGLEAKGALGPGGSALLTECPSDCSFHGVCIHTDCYCDEGWDGEACSYPVMAFVTFGVRAIRPTAGLAIGGTPLFLTGFNFADTPQLTCRFAPQVAGSMALGVRATFHNSSLVSCVAPPSAIAVVEGGEGRVLTTAELAPALSTPDMEYVVELAQEPPYFTNNGMRTAPPRHATHAAFRIRCTRTCVRRPPSRRTALCSPRSTSHPHPQIRSCVLTNPMSNVTMYTRYYLLCVELRWQVCASGSTTLPSTHPLLLEVRSPEGLLSSFVVVACALLAALHHSAGSAGVSLKQRSREIERSAVSHPLQTALG